MSGEILLIPFHGHGHLFPFSELCKHLLERNYEVTLVLSTSLTSSISSSLLQHPFVHIAELPISPHRPPPPGSDPRPHHHDDAGSQPLLDLLSRRSNVPDRESPLCAIVDVMMSWAREPCRRFNIPVLSFFTSGACSAAVEYALWKLQPKNINPDDSFTLPGLPEDMRLKGSDLTHRDPSPPPPPAPPPQRHGGDNVSGDTKPPPRGQPPGIGQKPPWVSETDGSVALLINTCDDLERPFIDYVAKETGKPVLGVGPLLPEQFWKSTDSLVHDHDVRTSRSSPITEEEIGEWLDSKSRGSVIYVAFGTEVAPTAEEMAELADALEESNRPFIWALQSGMRGPPPPPVDPRGSPPMSSGPHDPHGPMGSRDFFPEGLASRVKERGLIIRGWAPQLLILSHPSTAGFVSHCGWNSTLEAIGRRVPILAWPIRGDQHYNAKLVVDVLKIGFMVQSEDRSGNTTKDDVLGGIKKLIADDEIRKRGDVVKASFCHGFPASSIASLDELGDLIKRKYEKK